MQLDILKFIQSFHNPFLDRFFILSTQLGEENIYIIMIAIIYWCLDKKFGIKLGIAYLASTYINGIIKDLVASIRPIGFDGVRSIYTGTASGYSLPSGHTQGATVFWGYIAKQYKSRIVKWSSLIIIFLVGISRVYLGVHWPIDIVTAWTLGIVIVYSAFKTLNSKAIFQLSTLGKVMLSIIIPLGAYLVYNTYEFDKLIGVIAGTLAGYFIEQDKVNFNEEGKITNHLGKLIIGLSIALGIRIGLKMILPVNPYFEMVRYFILGLWITLGAPWLFTKTRLSLKNQNEFVS